MERDGGRARAGNRRALGPPEDAKGIALTPLARKIDGDRVSLFACRCRDRPRARAWRPITVRGPSQAVPASVEAAHALGDKFWPLTVARELEDAILHLRANEPTIGVVLFRTEGNAQAVLDHDAFLAKANGDWLMREIRHYLKRVLKRIDVTPRSFIALIEPGSCFAGTLAELAFAADRSLMLIGTREGDNRPAGRDHARARPISASIRWAMASRGLQTRFLGEPDTRRPRQGKIGAAIEGEEADRARPRHRRL